MQSHSTGTQEQTRGVGKDHNRALNSKAAYIINIYRYRMILLPHVVNFLPHKPQHVQLDELHPERSSSQCEISTYHCS